MGRASRDKQLRADTVPSGEDDVAWESALAARIREGDSHAFALLIEQYLDRLTRFAMAMVDSRDTAEDVVQYVFEKPGSGDTVWGRDRICFAAATRT